ncbi:ATP-binding protein [Chamaesiphon sp. VAR_48_metabat_135_sub]|uniref:AAA family ATPase n=1 Tax=Chamaesiphon sp. VAR_48_metabat_135_sub TaxID=2964699 RepID=UPI00286B10D1|nr:ATP-binding protein [Chamaesiphon sp. VAR_48_metabat_135_sub]
MLIEFSVGNYRSFKEVVTFSMVAAPIVVGDNPINRNNLFSATKEINLLKSTAIYGANASGKSNLVRAISFMKEFTINSVVGSRITSEINTDSYRLNTEFEGEPSYFEMVFIIGTARYRYGFEVDRQGVISEWLYQTLRTKESQLFDREGSRIKVFSKFGEGQSLENKTRKNALFLSVAAQFNGKIAREIIVWLHELNIFNSLDDDDYDNLTIDTLIQGHQTQDLIGLVTSLDLGIQDIQMIKTPIPEFPGGISYEVKTAHWKYDREGNKVATEYFELDEDESAGTQKLFNISGLLINILQAGEILIVDELDARLHPLISCAIVKLFNSPITNPRNAQLIFTTHDTNLLSANMFRKDQIWFTEKDRYGATDLYSLVEYQIPDDAPFEQDYIAGKYGAIPFIGDLNRVLGK